MAGQSASSLIAPIFPRLALGATLLWAGIGQLSAKMTVSGDRAAILANMEAIAPKSGAPAAPVVPPAKEEPKPSGAAPGKDSPKPEAPGAPKPQTPKTGGDTGFETPPLMQVTQTPPPPAPNFSAADFSEPVEVLRLYRVALLAHDAANPAARADGSAPRALWPKAAASGRWPVYVAWGGALAQVVGGAMLIVGLFTRLGAFTGALSIGLALWLVLIVPAVQSGNAQWGFIPPGGAWDVNGAGESVHGLFMWTVLQLCCALSLMFMGGGFLSLDRMLFPGGEGESRPKPKQLPARATPGE